MTLQSFLLIFLIALFPTVFSGIPLDRFFPYRTTHGDTEIEKGDDTGSPVLQTAETANRTRRQTEAHENWRNVSNSVKVPPMCPPLNHPKNGRCVSFRFLEDGEARCRCFPGFEFPKSNNRDEIRDKSVQKMRCQSSDAESGDESVNVKSVFWVPEKVTDCEPEEPEEKCEGCILLTFIPSAERSDITDSFKRKPQETGRHVSNNAPMCLPLVNPKNGYCMAKYHFEGDYNFKEGDRKFNWTPDLFEGAETQCYCSPGFEFPESKMAMKLGIELYKHCAASHLTQNRSMKVAT